MSRPHIIGRGGGRPVSPLIVSDLRAQLAPLNRYGLPHFSAAVVDGLHALIAAPRIAIRAVLAPCQAN